MEPVWIVSQCAVSVVIVVAKPLESVRHARNRRIGRRGRLAKSPAQRTFSGMEPRLPIRAVRPDDKERFRAAFRKLGSASIYTRFFGYRNELSEAELEQATNVDFDRVVALVATTGLAQQETIIAGARYATYEPSLKSAEVAFTVEEEYQGLGIATALLNQLVRIARAKDLSRFEAEVLP